MRSSVACSSAGLNSSPTSAPRSPAKRVRSDPRAASISAGIGCAAKSQITVRSLGARWNVSPWSMPKTRLVERSKRQCPPLRSALLMIASKTANRKNVSA